MTRPNEPSTADDFIAESKARVERTRRELDEFEKAQRAMREQQEGWQAKVDEIERLREEEMRRYAHRQVATANDHPPFPSAEVAVDKATRFARIVRRRRRTV
jgi:hypothetical protein